MKSSENQIKTSLENLGLAADRARNFVVIVKDGKIYKNTVK